MVRFFVLSFFFLSIGSFAQSKKIKKKEHNYNLVFSNNYKENCLISAVDYLTSDFKINYHYNKFYFRISIKNIFNIYAEDPDFRLNDLLENRIANIDEIDFQSEIPVYFKGKIIYKF